MVSQLHFMQYTPEDGVIWTGLGPVWLKEQSALVHAELNRQLGWIYKQRSANLQLGNNLRQNRKLWFKPKKKKIKKKKDKLRRLIEFITNFETLQLNRKDYLSFSLRFDKLTCMVNLDGGTRTCLHFCTLARIYTFLNSNSYSEL